MIDKGVFEYLKLKNITIPKIEGLMVMVDGRIPLGTLINLNNVK